MVVFTVVSSLNPPELDSLVWTETPCTCPGLRLQVSTRPAAHQQSPGGPIEARGEGSSPYWELKQSPGLRRGTRLWEALTCPHQGALTCPALQELGPLIRAAER